MKKTYDVLVIGPVSLDHNIDYQGNERKEVGGAVVASGFAAAKSGNRTAVFTKLNPADADVEERFAGSGADVYWKPSQATCSIRNQYFTADKEKRACTSMGVCDPFRFDELPDIETKIYHFAGLVYGDFDGALFAEAARHGKVAVDVQCLLRHVEADRTMAFHDWAEKKQYLPVIDYLKTDAAEAEILTGLTDRAEAAKLLHSWGAKEVLITHNTEVLAWAKINKGFKVGITKLGDEDTIAPAVQKGNKELLNWINDEIVKLGKENFFHKDYEETLVDTYGLDYEDELVVEGGVTGGADAASSEAASSEAASSEAAASEAASSAAAQ